MEEIAAVLPEAIGARLGRRRLLALGAVGSAGLVLGAAGPASAQRLSRPVRVGFLSPAQRGDPALVHTVNGLARAGWSEGRDYTMRTRFAEADPARLEPLLHELLREGIDILVTVGLSTRLVPLAERSVPVVFSFSGDPVAAGYVRSLASPGGNATGNTQLMWELVGKRLELLREIAPNSRRLLVVQSPDHPGEQEERARSFSVGTRLGFELLIRPVRDREALRAALADGESAGCDSLLCFTDAVTIPNRQLIADHAKRMRIPSVFPRREFCEAGGLVSYGPSIANLQQRLAGFIIRIANGTRPADIPVEWPTLIETVVNRRVAQELGFEFPPLVLLRADEVIE